MSHVIAAQEPISGRFAAHPAADVATFTEHRWVALYRVAGMSALLTGLLGGFTTFSTFGLDTFVLARTHGTMYAMVNVGVQVVGGLLAVAVGY
jgi:fluoride ion exporter CrcB/FEX